MNKTQINSKSRTPSRWFVAVSSLVISGFAIIVGNQHQFILFNCHGEVSMLTRRCPITGLIAVAVAVWAMKYLPPVVRIVVLGAAIIALARFIAKM